jgi:1-acylglycerone phosphate reductase
MPQVVLITGCSSGLGRALASRLAAEREADGSRSYTVYASARNAATLKGLEVEGVKPLALDVTRQRSVEEAVKRVVKEAGSIDVLVNNAGLSRAGPLVEQPLSEIEDILQTNVLGVVRVTQEVAPHMMRQRGGLIVMIGSVTAHMATPFAGAYSASKAALLGLTDSLRLELQPFGVQVSYVTAGSIKSALADNSLGAIDLQRYRRPGSLYGPLANTIEARARMSQTDPNVQPAEDVADQVAAVINASALGRSAPGSVVLGAFSRAYQALFQALCLAAGRRVAPAAGADSSSAAPVWQPRPPPNWFLAGGAARYYFLLGVAQKLLPGGWPTNPAMAKRFGLDQPLAA